MSILTYQPHAGSEDHTMNIIAGNILSVMSCNRWNADTHRELHTLCSVKADRGFYSGESNTKL